MQTSSSSFIFLYWTKSPSFLIWGRTCQAEDLLFGAPCICIVNESDVRVPGLGNRKIWGISNINSWNLGQMQWVRQEETSCTRRASMIKRKIVCQIWMPCYERLFDAALYITNRLDHSSNKTSMTYRIHILNGWNHITDPIEIYIAKKSVLRSLRTQYRHIRRVYGPPKSFKWVIWWVVMSPQGCQPLRCV